MGVLIPDSVVQLLPLIEDTGTNSTVRVGA